MEAIPLISEFMILFLPEEKGKGKGKAVLLQA